MLNQFNSKLCFSYKPFVRKMSDAKLDTAAANILAGAKLKPGFDDVISNEADFTRIFEKLFPDSPTVKGNYIYTDMLKCYKKDSNVVEILRILSGNNIKGAGELSVYNANSVQKKTEA